MSATMGESMALISKREVLSVQGQFTNDEIGLMLLKLDKHELSEEADTHARSLLHYAAHLQAQKERTSLLAGLALFTFVGAALVAFHGAPTWPVQDIWDKLAIAGNAVAGGIGGFVLFRLAHMLLSYLSIRAAVKRGEQYL